MPKLREVPPPATERATTQRELARRAAEALGRRLDQLERDQLDFQRRLVAAERAIAWLPSEEARARARRRLRALGHDRQLGPLRDLRSAREDAA